MTKKQDNSSWNPKGYRYERKFMVSGLTRSKVETLLKIHPAMFSEIYHQRFINNIYLDSHDLESYFHNIDGTADRFKIRIRWYGQLLGEIKSPTLELKIKKGLLGRKETYPLESFALKKGFSTSDIRKVFERSKLPKALKIRLASIEPTLLNRYSRKYFQSASKHYRATVDSGLTFYHLSPNRNLFKHKHEEHHDLVMEIKYDLEKDRYAHEITSYFPFDVSKSSKYIEGIRKLDLW